MPKALELTTPELGEKFRVAGTPEEVVERLQRDILSTGMNHIIGAVVDPYLVKAFTGIDIANAVDTHAQLRLIRDRVMPSAGQGADAGLSRLPTSRLGRRGATGPSPPASTEVSRA